MSDLSEWMGQIQPRRIVEVTYYTDWFRRGCECFICGDQAEVTRPKSRNPGALVGLTVLELEFINSDGDFETLGDGAQPACSDCCKEASKLLQEQGKGE